MFEGDSLDLRLRGSTGHGTASSFPVSPGNALGAAGATRASSARQAVHHSRPQTDTSELFARFPHLRRIEAIWGSRECRELLSGLMLDTRAGARQGFPAEHASTIFKLILEHDASFPQHEGPGHVWQPERLR